MVTVIVIMNFRLKKKKKTLQSIPSPRLPPHTQFRYFFFFQCTGTTYEPRDVFPELRSVTGDQPRSRTMSSPDEKHIRTIVTGCAERAGVQVSERLASLFVSALRHPQPPLHVPFDKNRILLNNISYTRWAVVVKI